MPDSSLEVKSDYDMHIEDNNTIEDNLQNLEREKDIWRNIQGTWYGKFNNGYNKKYGEFALSVFFKVEIIDKQLKVIYGSRDYMVGYEGRLPSNFQILTDQSIDISDKLNNYPTYKYDIKSDENARTYLTADYQNGRFIELILNYDYDKVSLSRDNDFFPARTNLDYATTLPTTNNNDEENLDDTNTSNYDRLSEGEKHFQDLDNQKASNDIPTEGETIKFKVVSDRSYFYSEKDELTKKKAYVTKGDIVESNVIDKDWVLVSFTNDAGSTTTGFLKTSTLFKED